MAEHNIDIEDIEAFIDGLKKSFDVLDEIDPHQGFQMQLARAISSLREKKVSKMEPLPKTIGPVDMRKYLLRKLKDLKHKIEKDDVESSKKFKLVMEIAKLREKLKEL